MRFSIEAEQSVIGGLLIDPSKLDDVCELITDADYYNSDNRAVFAAICAMANDNQPIDVITLSEKLDAMGELERVGGIGYLIEMHNNTPSAANIMSYARIIADRSMDRRIVESGIRICQLGEKDGDVDEKLNTLHGELEALERKDDAGYVGFDSILKTCIQRIDEKHRGKQVDCIKTGFTALDERLVVEPTDFWVIAARPAMGKTALAMNIAYSVANTGKEVIVFSMEMSKEQLMDRLLCAASGVPADVIRSGKLEGDQWNNLSMGVAKLKGLKIHIIEIPAIDINRALAISRKFAKRGNVGLIVVDYLQLMTTSGDKRFDVVSEVSRKLKVMAKTVKAPVLALSQLSRKCEERKDARPIMSDLRESGQIEQDADIISFIYRDEYYNEDSPNKGCAEIITRKYRNGEIGTDIIGTQFQYSRFINIDFSNYQFNTEQQAKPRKGFD
jgi:replicative DNA helicase